MEELLDFLNLHKSKENFTHVSLVGGKYTIPYYRNDDFLELYVKAVSKGKKLYLVERLETTFRYFIDLDIKEKIEFDKVQEYISQINSILLEVFDIEEVKCIISNNENNYHINYPDIVVNSQIALLLMNRFKELYIFEYMDRSVYKNNGLRMVGSRKSKENQGYYRIVNDKRKLTCLKDLTLDDMSQTSIRTDKGLTKMKEELEFTEETIHCINKTKVIISEIGTEIEEYLSSIKQSVEFDICLDVRGIKVVENKGINHIYVNIDEKFCPFKDREHKRNCPPIYLDICKVGSYIRCYDMDCMKKMYPNESLPMPENETLLKIIDYTTDISDNMMTLLECAMSGTHYDIAKVVEEYIGEDIRVDCVKNEEWYEFNQSKHRWIKTSRIRNILSTEIVDLFKMYNKGGETNKVINDICRNLKTVGFKTSIMNELAYVLNQKDNKFAEKLDSNIRLMCFNNGVLDMSNDDIIFRNGRRDDYISMCTNIDYYPYDNDLHDIKKVESLLSEIFVDKQLMDYVVTVFSKCLVGEKEEVFYILNGSGSNGKSVSSSLIEASFGDYAGGASVALLTQKRNRSSAPTPDVVMLKGKRIVTMHEPENDDELKVGLMKQMSGGDKIQARALHKAPIEFTPQFKMFMNCNKLPKISANDDGTWRRMRVIEFKSKFVNKPDARNKYEFKRDNDLMRKIDLLGSAFMSILVNYYKNYRKNGIEVPDEVMKFTNEYKQESDVYTQFMDEMIVKNETEYLSVDQLKGVFDMWWDDNLTEKNKTKKIEFRKIMVTKLGKCIRKNNSLGWKISVNNIISEESDELE